MTIRNEKHIPTAIEMCQMRSFENPSQFDSTTKKEQLLKSIRSLSAEEVMNWIDDIYAELEHLKKREDCFFLHDMPDGYYYAVVYEDGSIYRFNKGERAYAKYLFDDTIIEIQRYDANELFPTYETILRKERIIEA